MKHRNKKDYEKQYRKSILIVVVLLAVLQIIPVNQTAAQFLVVALIVLFSAFAFADFMEFHRNGALNRKQIETDIANRTPETVYMDFVARAFDAVSVTLDKFAKMSQPQRDDFLFAFPVLLDLQDVFHRNRPYTVKQAQLVLFHRLERKHSFWYLPVIRKHKTAERVWLSALENDLIELGCAQRENKTDRAYLIETPETCFEKLFFSFDDLFSVSKIDP